MGTGSVSRRAAVAGAAALLWSALLGCAMLGAGCERRVVSSRRPGPLRVVVSVAPLMGLVKPLAPPGADVSLLVPAGRSLHGYEPAAADLAAIAEADVLVYVGLGLEPAIERMLGSHASETRREVCFARAVGIEGSGHEGHEGHGHEDEHETTGIAQGGEARGTERREARGADHGTDPHLWLDPELVARLIPELAQQIEDASRDAGRLNAIEEDRLRDAKFRLLAEVESIDQEHRERLEPFAGAAIVTHHNAFGRLADRYGLTIAAVIRPIEGAEPSPGQIAEAVEAIRREKARGVFFEPQYNPAAAQAIAEAAGVPSGVLDPEGREDWAGLMRANLDSLVKMLGGP